MSRRPCIFGEVLFDHFADGKRVLGGAPFNVAWHLQAFGQSPLLVSRVGEDAEARDPAGDARAGAWTAADCSRSERPTGRVDVRIEDGEPAYDIVESQRLRRHRGNCRPADCRLIYHGSLALREGARGTRWSAAGDRPQPFVDVNLRPPWWRRDEVLGHAAGAHWVKLNRDELESCSAARQPPTPPAFLEHTTLRAWCSRSAPRARACDPGLTSAAGAAPGEIAGSIRSAPATPSPR